MAIWQGIALLCIGSGKYLHTHAIPRHIALPSGQKYTSLHAMHLYIGAHVTEVTCEANHFLERR